MAPLLRFGGARRLDVLVVCTGNVCRSPYVAALLRARQPALEIASAGTGALTGQPPTPQVLYELAVRGVPAGSGTARQVSRRLVRDARLVLTATRAHRVTVARLDAGAASRTFTLKELARLLADDERAGGFEDVLARVRHLDAERVDHDDDLADPYGLGPAAYARMVAEVDAAVSVIAPALSTATA